MPITSEELEMAKKAAELANFILPELRLEAALTEARIKWHEANLAAWETMRSKESNPQPHEDAKIDQLIAASPRARRNEAEDRVLRIMKAHPDIKAKDISEALKAEYGATYPLSTIYRIINLVKEQSKTPA